jgi:DNA-binding MarR family transcriptional regulator
MTNDPAALLTSYFRANQILIDTSRYLTAANVDTFLTVAMLENREDMSDGVRLRAIGEATGRNFTRVSHDMRSLGKGVRRGRPGAGLVETEIAPDNMREKVARLTPKGREVFGRLREALSAS